MPVVRYYQERGTYPDNVERELARIRNQGYVDESWYQTYRTTLLRIHAAGQLSFPRPVVEARLKDLQDSGDPRWRELNWAAANVPGDRHYLYCRLDRPYYRLHGERHVEHPAVTLTTIMEQ